VDFPAALGFNSRRARTNAAAPVCPGAAMPASRPGALRRIPPLLLQPLRHAPPALLDPLLDQALAAFFREALGADELAELEGRRVCLSIQDAGLELPLTVEGGRPVMLRQALEPEVTIRGNLEEFMLLAASIEDPDTQFFQRRLSIEGDTELGLAVKNLIYSLDPDRFPPLLNRILRALGDAIVQTRNLGL
jgi:predicted lipid carrier protein YhbT